MSERGVSEMGLWIDGVKDGGDGKAARETKGKDAKKHRFNT